MQQILRILRDSAEIWAFNSLYYGISIATFFSANVSYSIRLTFNSLYYGISIATGSRRIRGGAWPATFNSLYYGISIATSLIGWWITLLLWRLSIPCIMGFPLQPSLFGPLSAKSARFGHRRRGAPRLLMDCRMLYKDNRIAKHAPAYRRHAAPLPFLYGFPGHHGGHADELCPRALQFI